MRPTKALLDVNVLIAGLFEDHVHHVQAYSFLLSLEQFYTSATTQGGFLRFATRPWRDEFRNENPPRLTMQNAQQVLLEFTRAEGHMFLPDDEPFTAINARRLQGHRQWTDAYLLHLARKHSLPFASLDDRMAELDDPSKPTLFVLR